MSRSFIVHSIDTGWRQKKKNAYHTISYMEPGKNAYHSTFMVQNVRQASFQSELFFSKVILNWLNTPEKIAAVLDTANLATKKF